MTAALVDTAERILLIDAEPDLLAALGDLLLGIGHAVAGAADGGTALALVRSFRPTAILLDLRVPGLATDELAAQVRRLVPPPRMIALTADGSAAARQRAVTAGMCDFLVKPVSVQKLLRVLERSRRRAPAVATAPAPSPVRRRREARADQYSSVAYRELLVTLAMNIRNLRHAHGWTQEEAARRCAMAPRLIQRLEAAALNATMTTLARLCEGFEVDAATLLGRPARTDVPPVPGARSGRPEPS